MRASVVTADVIDEPCNDKCNANVYVYSSVLKYVLGN